MNNPRESKIIHESVSAAWLLALLLLPAHPAVAQGQFNYAINDGTITITGYNGPGGAVDIPSIINGLPVTSIGDHAFSYCDSLTRVTIGNGITSIGWQSFYFCTNLTSVTIPDSVTLIVGQTFWWCPSLTNVTLGNGLTNIGYWAFEDCTSLTSITIPNSVTRIQNGAFGGCSSLNNVVIPGGVTSIEADTFEGCSSLTAITFPDNITSIEENAFGGTGLTSFTIPDTVTNLGDMVFRYCSALTNVTIGSGVTSIESETFFDCTRLTSVRIGRSVTSIGRQAFTCTSLTNVTIPESVTNIGVQAFWGCTSLTGVYFCGNAPSVAQDAFGLCYNATFYYLPGTSGWGSFNARPWPQPLIHKSPQTQTAEAGSAIGLQVQASGSSPLFCLWYLNGTNLVTCSTNSNLELDLTNLQFSQSGVYTAVITNAAGAVTSSPAMLQVIAPVERRPVPGLEVMVQNPGLLNVDYADSLSSAPNWIPLGSLSLASAGQYYFDLTEPLASQRFYRAWPAGTPPVPPSLSMLGMVPLITLTGNIGDTLRLDYINRFGPINAWVTLDTVTLTNTSQLYFDTSSISQPPRLWRIVQVP